jgi:hypothetical protein
MPLRKSPVMTSRLLAANRANAQHSTGPQTPQGKARSRLNGLRTGKRSKDFQRLNRVLAWCSPADIRATAAAILTPEQLEHPFFAREIRCWEEACEIAEGDRRASPISVLQHHVETKAASAGPNTRGFPLVAAENIPRLSGPRVAALPAAAPRKFHPSPY